MSDDYDRRNTMISGELIEVKKFTEYVESVKDLNSVKYYVGRITQMVI